LGANCGLMHRSKTHRYSIILSARASTVAGTSTSSAFAVLRQRRELHRQVRRLRSLQKFSRHKLPRRRATPSPPHTRGAPPARSQFAAKCPTPSAVEVPPAPPSPSPV